jgi:hypothetical protein
MPSAELFFALRVTGSGLAMTHVQARAAASKPVRLCGGEVSLSRLSGDEVKSCIQAIVFARPAPSLPSLPTERLASLQVPQPHLLDERIGDFGVAVALANDEVGRHQLVDGRGDVVGGDLAAQRLAE